MGGTEGIFHCFTKDPDSSDRQTEGPQIRYLRAPGVDFILVFRVTSVQSSFQDAVELAVEFTKF